MEEEGKLVPGSEANTAAVAAADKAKRPFREADSLYVTVTVSELLQNRTVAGQWVDGDVVGLRITVYDPETSQRAQRDIPTTTASLIQVCSPLSPFSPALPPTPILFHRFSRTVTNQPTNQPACGSSRGPRPS